jgi:hypothetical protein
MLRNIVKVFPESGQNFYDLIYLVRVSEPLQHPAIVSQGSDIIFLTNMGNRL